jgi:hypothetical protein
MTSPECTALQARTRRNPITATILLTAVTRIVAVLLTLAGIRLAFPGIAGTFQA